MNSRAHFLARMMFLVGMHSRYRPLLYARMRMTSLNGCPRSFPRENVSSRENIFWLQTAMVGENDTRVIAVSSKNLAGECARRGVIWQCAIYGRVASILTCLYTLQEQVHIDQIIYICAYIYIYVYIYICILDWRKSTLIFDQWYLIIDIQSFWSLRFNRSDHWDLIIDIERFGHLITNGDLPEYIVESPPVRKHARQMPPPDRS